MSQGSLDLWAAAKIIGRECSTVNKDYLICKKEKGENPTVCASQGDLVATCTDNT